MADVPHDLIPTPAQWLSDAFTRIAWAEDNGIVPTSSDLFLLHVLDPDRAMAAARPLPRTEETTP